MPAKEVVVAEREPEDLSADLRAHVESKCQDAVDQATIELAEAPFPTIFDWEVLAWGPWQLPFDPAVDPGRIIFVGEYATVATWVVLNPSMAQNVAGFGAKIQLSYWTSNTQTMQPVPDLSYSSCLEVYANQYYYYDYFTFRPSDPACLYEMNICARVCNCEYKTVPGYAAFVRHVFDYDPEHLGLIPSPSPGWQFDRPIRFMVADDSETCCNP
jgi:hypothetical protein